jgi:hypothetical protein
MFRLGQQIRRNEIGPRCLVRNDNNLSRPRNRIDSHNAEHELLRRRHILVARSGYLVDTRHTFRPESERCNRVRATNRINFTDIQLK